MNDQTLMAIYSLVAIGALASIILFISSKKFFIFEDPDIDIIEEILPAANCGGCGYPGCRPFAQEVVKEKNLDVLYCPVGGSEVMGKIADYLNIESVQRGTTVAVLKCNGTNKFHQSILKYEGASSCALAHSLYGGEGACTYGCLKLADCCNVCDFDALHISESTGLPVVDELKCTSCGACVKACPRGLFEIREKTDDLADVYVACSNYDRGNIAKKNCLVACTGCMKCVKVYDNKEMVNVENFLCYIQAKTDLALAQQMADVCPTNAILAKNVDRYTPVKVKGENDEA